MPAGMLTANAESGSSSEVTQQKRATRSSASSSPTKTMKNDIENLKKALQAQKKAAEDESKQAEKSYKFVIKKNIKLMLLF